MRHRIHQALEKRFPERRLFLRTDEETRFVRLGPGTQIAAILLVSVFVGWAIIATAIVLMDSIGSGNFRDQAKRDQRLYETRLNSLAMERDQRATEASAAQDRFSVALGQVSQMQSQLLESEEKRKELERGIDVVQATLLRTMNEKEAIALELTQLKGNVDTTAADASPEQRIETLEQTVLVLNDALGGTSRERDLANQEARTALNAFEDLNLEMQLAEEKNDQIFRKLEDAMTISVKPLDRMFRNAGLNTNTLLGQVRSAYGGQGGPLTPLNIASRGVADVDRNKGRANRILEQLDRLNVYRIAAERAPFAMPIIGNSYRTTSGFGPRWGRMHKGLDFAAAHGTPIKSTADGVVIFAGWASGYGRLVKIQHEFGIETRYAHLARIRVKKGQRVSRGQRIGDMGSSGRSTGTHLHYEIRVGGRAINPMIYIRAGRDVF